MSIFTLFNLLTKAEQADMLLEEGNFLYTRDEPQFLIDLYSVEDFFVEVYYHKRQENLIVVKSFYAKDQHGEIHYDRIPDMALAWRKPHNAVLHYGRA